MAIDVVAELVGNIVEALSDVVFHGARGWSAFWRIIIVFVLLPMLIFGLCYWLSI